MNTTAIYLEWNFQDYDIYSLLQQKKCPKQKKGQREEDGHCSFIMKKQEAKNMANPMRKGLSTSALDKTPRPTGTSHALSSNGLVPSGYNSKEPSSVSSSKYFLRLGQLIQTLDCYTATTYFSLPQSAGQERPSWRRS